MKVYLRAISDMPTIRLTNSHELKVRKLQRSFTQDEDAVIFICASQSLSTPFPLQSKYTINVESRNGVRSLEIVICNVIVKLLF